MTLERFPRTTLRGDRTIHRIHRSANSPWWFSVDGTGRFDPVGTARRACYLAEHPLGAWVEVFRKRMMLSEAEITERSLFSVALERDIRLANLTSRRALEFGVTASLGANEEYGGSQAFAAQALEAGFDGVRYLLRHDPAQRLYGLALFGVTGETPRLAAGEDHDIPDALVREAEATFGYRVLPPP